MKTFFYSLIFLIFNFNPKPLDAQINQIIIGANNNGAVFSSFLDGTNPTIINTNQSYHSFYGAVNDPVEEKIYMSWYYGIYSMDYDGSNFIQLYDYPSGGMGGAIDFYNEQIYFADEGSNICKINKNGTNKDTIYSGLNYVSDLQIDTSTQEIYISRWLNGGFDKINIDGTGYTSIFTTNSPDNFKIDFNTQMLFFGSNAKVYSSNLNGANITEIHDFQAGEIDIYQNKLYITDMSNVKIISSDYNGSNIDTLVEVGDITFGADEFETPFGLVLLKNDNACDSYINDSVTKTLETISINIQDSTFSYQWLDCNNGNSIITDSISNSFTASVNGAYAIEISTSFCKDTSDCVSILSTGINKEKITQISIYPNPTTGLVNIDSEDINTIKIYSIEGKLIETLNNNVTFNLPNESGYYILKIISKNKIDFFKILKE